MLHVKDNSRKTKTRRVGRSLPPVGELPVDTSSSSKTKKQSSCTNANPTKWYNTSLPGEEATRLREHHVGVGIASLGGTLSTRTTSNSGENTTLTVVVWQSSTHSLLLPKLRQQPDAKHAELMCTRAHGVLAEHPIWVGRTTLNNQTDRRNPPPNIQSGTW
ncbi:unnamed protein product [Ectocarpus sp. 12 AP-2014]